MKELTPEPCPFCENKPYFKDGIWFIQHEGYCSLRKAGYFINQNNPRTVLLLDSNVEQWNKGVSNILPKDKMEDIAVRFFRYAHARMHQMSIREIWKQFVEVDKGV